MLSKTRLPPLCRPCQSTTALNAPCRCCLSKTKTAGAGHAQAMPELTRTTKPLLALLGPPVGDIDGQDPPEPDWQDITLQNVPVLTKTRRAAAAAT